MKTYYQDTRVLLSVLWIFVALNFFAKDIHELGRPGMLEQMMSGTIDGVQITEALMLLGGVMIEIPILMTVLPLLFLGSILIDADTSEAFAGESELIVI